MADILYMVIPCYNEEEVLNETSKRLEEKFIQLLDNKLIDEKSKIMLVDDGSKDKTWKMIEDICKKCKFFQGLKLSCNKGHQNAVLAGLSTACKRADMIISMDADLQDDINAIDKFVEQYYNGYDVVYGVRSERKTDTFFKRNTALAFYKLMKALGVNIVYNHADFRLMSKRALSALLEFKEVNLFLRGLVPLVGFKSCSVEYARDKRFAGESKYPLKKMLAFAFDGISSFSIKPIRMILNLGILIFFVSLIIIIYSLVRKLLGFTISGWASTLSSIWLIGGLNLLAMGIVGEYIGKIYKEVKARPRFIVEEYIENNEEK